MIGRDGECLAVILLRNREVAELTMREADIGQNIRMRTEGGLCVA